MHELIRNDWLDHDYLARHTLGWAELRERALQWPPSRAAAVCGLTEAEIVALAADIGASFQRREPVAIRLNYGMQRARRRQRGAGDRLHSGLDRRLAASFRRVAAEQFGRLPGPACGP
ncbi:hypothetical protein [Thauera humireducens]|uniref:hypothetical protein n=1 Tax=Thauera humireducens TaxID=1134435 RepID=UPI00311EAF13